MLHHGGAGTTAAGLLAGAPTVVVPFFADQFFWGRRVAALGAGPRGARRERLTAERVAAALSAAVDDPRFNGRPAASPSGCAPRTALPPPSGSSSS